MAIRLMRIRIQNFKPFEDYLVKFNSRNLVVFDGPNGFGKTSFYDAIELLFTGYLRRYVVLTDMAVDKRQTSIGNPLLNDRGVGDLVIKCELEVDGNTVCLARRGARKKLEVMTQLDKLKLELYKVSQFDNGEFVVIDDEIGYLTRLLGKDYISNFEFLNYIEQDENIYLLKNKGKDRKEAIAHLFNTSGFDERISQLKDASKSIGKLCGKEAKDSLLSRKQVLDDNRSKFTSEKVPEPYAKIISWKEIDWDAEKLEISSAEYVDWLGGDGKLGKIEYFLDHIDEFKNAHNNNKLDDLFADESLVTQLLLFWNYIDSEDDFKKKLALSKSIDDLLQSYEQDLVGAIINRKVDIDPQIQELVASEIDVQSYSDLIEDILKIHKNANTLSQLIIDVKGSRQAFIDKYTKYEAEAGPDESCPLCGFTWKDTNEMKANFDSQAERLEELISISGTDLNLKVESFTKKFLTPIKKLLKEYQSQHFIDEMFVRELSKAVNNYANLNTLNKQFAELDVDIKPFLNDKPLAEEEIDLNKLRAIVSDKKHLVNLENIRPDFGTIFLQVFDESYKHVSDIDKPAIASKRKYIEWQHSLYQSAYIKELENGYDKQNKQLNDAKSIKTKIDNLGKIYEKSLKSYQRSLIEDIEILFHIYSGRIAQEGKGSLGLFINSENGIRFLENHSKQHDAIFTMSSGQLATLVIAFTLALNKRYSKNEFLFIDDPIQTLDELNIAGLVELLRNEFSDRQIFISTHEDMMSAYMRYKFKKYGLGEQRVSFKDSQLSLN
ncbi:AAA family ATPase [Pseudomonadota bacterium]